MRITVSTLYDHNLIKASVKFTYVWKRSKMYWIKFKGSEMNIWTCIMSNKHIVN